MTEHASDSIIMSSKEAKIRKKIISTFFGFSVVSFIVAWFLLLYVYRAPLPDLADFNQLFGVEETASLSAISISIVVLGALNDAKGLQAKLNDIEADVNVFEYDGVKEYANIITQEQSYRETDNKLHALITDDDILYSHCSNKDLIIFVVFGQSTKNVVLGEHIHSWSTMNSESDIITVLYPFIKQFPYFEIYNPHDQDIMKLSTRAEYTLSLSLLNPSPSKNSEKKAFYDWDIMNASEQLLKPFLRNLEPMMSIDIDTQVLFYADIAHDNEFQYNKNHEIYELNIDSMHTFFGQANWNRISPFALSSLEFMVYIPSKSHYPLSFTNGSNSCYSFVIPEWGGVVILNGLDDISDKQQSNEHNQILQMINVKELEPAFDEIIHRMRNMLGLIHIPSLEEQQKQQHKQPFIILPTTQNGISGWEYDMLLRERVRFHTLEVLSTLSSLFELLDNVDHLPMKDEIGQNVTRTVELLHEIKNILHNSSDHTRRECLQRLMTCIREAIVTSRSGFYDPSMIPLLYFPNEHIYAVYCPFFVPILAPILGAWKKRKKEVIVDNDDEKERKQKEE